MSVPLAKSEMVYRDLREGITSGRFGTGYRLVLGQIAKELGVSAVPVREAIRRLEAERLVTFTPNVGATVASVDVDQYADVMETLAFLDGAATSLAARELTPEQLDKAEAINDQMWKLSQHNFDPRWFTQLNQQFHEELFEACPNKYLVSMVEVEWERVALIRRSDYAFAPTNAHTSAQEHAHMLELIRNRAPLGEIELAAREHKLRTRRIFVEMRSAV